MFDFSFGELMVVALVALVVLGPERLPEMARGAGKMLHKVRTMTEGVQSEVRDVMADPSMQPLKELGELAARPRQKLTEYALEAEAEERAKREAKEAAAAEAAVAEAEAAEADADGADADGSDTDGATPTDADSAAPVGDHEPTGTDDEATPATPASTQEPG